jgi:hypothetical protein
MAAHHPSGTALTAPHSMTNSPSRRDRGAIRRGGAWRKLAACCALLPFWAASPGRSAGDSPSGPDLIQEMAGVWSVEEWLWPSPGAEAVSLPAAIARRQLVGNDFMQEVMSTPDGAKEPFTRISYFGYNAVSRQFEYFSLDTRAPQMMTERSDGASARPSDPGPLSLPGGTFVAPQWGLTATLPFDTGWSSDASKTDARPSSFI